MPPSEEVYAYGVSQGPTIKSPDLPPIATLSVTGRERRAINTQLDQTRKNLSI
jgi:hypothetical protein